MKETINERLEQIINERFNGNKTAFATSINMPPTSLSNYIGKQRRSKLSADIVTNIVVNLGVDPMWLLTGEGKQASVHTEGDYSPASVNGSVSVNVDTKALQDKISMLEQMLEEKERTIKILMER